MQIRKKKWDKNQTANAIENLKEFISFIFQKNKKDKKKKKRSKNIVVDLQPFRIKHLEPNPVVNR